ncbi:isocitrate/isopropylmalate dehydrogenase family protein [Pseudonocardia sp. N23]|uniref:isocitrate/isopropylmalate dehydrogenase family protein n=1 Tax=Pseudonocardia sp. N23 TaxID=1987376 RepID=UPI000BFBE359|nr:isocitrate/isopropylmalate dehydrogenase family protein [Pseudonocardia sp. N23]GAY07525.1 3-isopropylmalate dehydrogenase [Pseudonocardia sp. N23]
MAVPPAPAAYDVVVLPGDGIGVEVMDSGVAVLRAVAEPLGLRVDLAFHEAGAGAFAKTGVAIAESVLAAAGQADAVLFGAMGLPDVRREDGTEIAPQLDLRERFGLVAGVRPATLLPGIDRVLYAPHIDFVTVRESTEGLFAGRNDPPSADPDVEHDRMTITREASETLFDVSFGLAAARRRAGGPGRVTLFDKANVLKSQAFLRRIFDEVAERHPDIETEHVYVDAGVMMMVREPERFDVVVMENMFGDIVSDLAAGITGGLGLAPSADIGREHAVFQPCHGTAPDIAGRDLANPVGMVLSVAMMLDWLGDRHEDSRCTDAARRVRSAVDATLAAGTRTRDVGGTASTTDVTAAIVGAL